MPTPTPSIRIRMYRVGFGDCFLVSFPLASGETRHILIDCGVHPAGDAGVMPQVVQDIATETNRKLALVLVTHNHKDHLSGFASCAQEWRSFQVDNVWLPWTEKPGDPEALALRQKQLALAAAISRHIALQPPAPAVRAAVEGVLQLLGANEDALSLLNAGVNGGQVSYLKAGASFADAAGIPGLAVKILAPPCDQKFLARLNPPASERFLRAAGDPELEGFDQIHPFPKKWVVLAKSNLVYEALTERDKNLLAVAATNAEDLAFSLDDAMNNTSIVSHLCYRGKGMLFAGDAQYGNWQSWIGSAEAASILASTNFIKVAHHGSENATPKSVVEGLPQKAFAAMISTQNKPWASIPLGRILDAISARSLAAVRSDSLPIPGAPAGPTLTKLPQGFKQGKLWFDYLLPVNLA
jgi:beta-lactamase superfamily II metal-dependent hydrolase